MELLKIQIKAKSPFISFPKGDMIFGNFCWLLEKEKIKKLVEEYQYSPKVIFSDFFPKGYLPKASLPDNILFDDYKIEERKVYKSKKYISSDSFFMKNKKDKIFKKVNFINSYITTHNSINRLTNSTDEEFKPYNLESFVFNQNIELYVLFDESFISENELVEKIKTLGKFGFGKKSSIGYGQFEVNSSKVLDIDYDSKYSITLSPSNLTQKSFYKPYMKFGKYGNSLSYLTYKNPILLADTSSIVKSSKKYIGTSIIIDKNIEIDNNKTNIIHQGYSILFPFRGYEEFLDENFDK
ncbi:type III-A CRISPR-associated RAMP protein Csm4 [Malaciobacter sp. WC5094]